MEHVDRAPHHRDTQPAYAARLAVGFHFFEHVFQCYLRQFSELLQCLSRPIAWASCAFQAAAKTSFRCDFSVTFGFLDVDLRLPDPNSLNAPLHSSASPANGPLLNPAWVAS
jgi:hypothetical protein